MRNLWHINAMRHVTKHPTEKPVTLLDRIVKIASNPGDSVLDPFMGSGTTGVVAQSLGRNFLGFEIDADYFRMAVKRIRAEAKKTAPELSPIIKATRTRKRKVA